ncbi:hypothetical protein TSMEX_003345 [Taenia solium]|eukprot:TsM_000338300 transcript=TsM_000338300 gene=TsM_000338300
MVFVERSYMIHSCNSASALANEWMNPQCLHCIKKHRSILGWIVRPVLSMDVVDFPLYAGSPCLYHAAYRVAVSLASGTRSASEVAAILRVASSAGMVVEVSTGVLVWWRVVLCVLVVLLLAFWRVVIAEAGAVTEDECEGRSWEKQTWGVSIPEERMRLTPVAMLPREVSGW